MNGQSKHLAEVGDIEEEKVSSLNTLIEEEKFESSNEEEYEEFPWPCGFCHTCYGSQEEFDGHKMRKHGNAKMSMDNLDERSYAKSVGPYHINECLIQTKHSIDPTLTARIQANPKVLNAKAPQLQANFWGIYDVEKKEIVHGKLVDNRREVASVTKIMTAYAVIEVARKYTLDLTKI